jgi:hypothetical protein
MHDLAELARLRSDVRAAQTHAAFARLADAISAEASGACIGRHHAAFTRRLGPPGPRIRNLAIAAMAIVALAAVALAAMAAITLGQGGRSTSDGTAATRLTPAPPGTWWTYAMPSVGVATSAARLVAYATKAAAKAPLFPVPKPTDWYYTETLGPEPPYKPAIDQYWQQIGTYRAADAASCPALSPGLNREHQPRPSATSCGMITASPGNAKLSYTRAGGPGAGLVGWPGNWTTMYRYLAHLPASIPALRAVILANVKHDHPKNLPSAASEGLIVGTFHTISALLNAFAVPQRLQAELYGVLVSLPGVRFDKSVKDGVGRAGVGLYVVQGGWDKQEIIVDPKTYAYMGTVAIAVRTYTERCSGMCWPKVTHYRKGEVIGWSVRLAQGIVQQAGQIPGR